MSHGLEVIDRTVEKTYEWLDEIARRDLLDEPHRAYQVLRAVLHALRDRLEPDVAAHLAAQLPLLVRGLFYEGWDPSSTPMRLSLAEFLGRVESEAGLKGPSEAEDAARAVLSLLRDDLGQGTVDHLVSVLPREFADLV
ncbi:MAG TPA: DUF2267 domain-containing protein [Acidimicrobiales bacterium]|nr:DUF2267 domain-containing protein [Acidimicrobiales bacterium]